MEGVVVEEAKPEFTFRNCCNGSFQQQVEPYLKQHLGCREPLIRLYNQYLWDFYGKTPVTDVEVVFGKDGWMYEPWVVADYYQRQFRFYASDSAQMATLLTEEAHRLSQLQQALEPYGTHLFVCMAPAKDMICPEYLPENQDTRYDDQPKISARYFNEEIYTQLGVNHLNLEQWFLQIKDTADFMLFPKTGTHWTRYASLYAADTLIRYMEHLGEINIPNLVIGPKHLGKKAIDPDDDLESLLNLMRPLPKPKYYYAKASSDHDTTAVKPKVIVIGDSFWWNICLQLPLEEFFSSAPYWYYNSTVHYYEHFTSVDQLNLLEELTSADYIVLLYSATQQYHMNDGFTRKALEALGILTLDSNAFIEREIQRTIANIMVSPQWMDMVREKAEKRGVSVEQALHDDAEWVVNNKIKEGILKLPTLEQDTITKQDNHGIQ